MLCTPMVGPCYFYNGSVRGAYYYQMLDTNARSEAQNFPKIAVSHYMRRQLPHLNEMFSKFYTKIYDPMD